MGMRKFYLSAILCLGALTAQAEILDVMTSYIYSSDYNQARVGASAPITYNTSVGMEVKYVEDKISVSNGGLKNPVYSLYAPMQLDLEIAHFNLIPFYYFNNQSHLPNLHKAAAYGLSGQLTMDLLKDDANDIYTQAYINAAYARQKGNLLTDNSWKNRYFDQTAFTLGFKQNWYSTFSFNIAATAYVYPDGISQVQNFHGILDQKDLGFTQSFDVNRFLGKYTLSARLTRMWPEKHSSLYLGYHYEEFYTADPEHSALIGNSFYITRNVYTDMAYNHIETNGNTNKRDLFFINLNFIF